MAAEDEDFDGGEGGEAEFEGGGGGGGLKKKLLIIVPLVLVIGGGAAAYFFGLADPLIAMVTGGKDHAEEGAEGEHKAAEAATPAANAEAPGTAVFYALEPMMVNINSGRQRQVLKASFVLELTNEADVDKVAAVTDRIRDSFLTYLRECRPEDLQGSAGSFRLKEELLTRVSAAVRPTKVRDVLFKELIVN